MVSSDPYARIALAIPVRELFDYRVPDSMSERVLPGSRVRVPFGRSFRVGYCIERSPDTSLDEVKDVDDVLDDEPLLDANLLTLVRWTADYYLASVGEVIESAIPKRVREGRLRHVKWVRRATPAGEPVEDRRAGAQHRQKILALLGECGPLPLAELLERGQVSRSPVDTLVKRGLVELFEAPPPEAVVRTDAEASEPHTLSADQEGAVERIRASIYASQYATYLLHGVTGSGKTEVYLQCIQTALDEGLGALVLLPEIALTPQTVARFQGRFGEVAVLHSMLPPEERSRQYRRLRQGELRVAIGARSAIFAPIAKLGIIVVDESHESSYKQESSPRYHGRDLATVRAKQQGIPCVLGTATPTMESLHNGHTGRFTILSLPRRVTRHSLAEIEIVDRRQDEAAHANHLLSRRLIDDLDKAMKLDQQAILLLNRRGFARHIHCRRCGFALRCTDCDIGLTYHKRANSSQCHYCGTTKPVPNNCPDCSFPLGRSLPGTERIEETLRKLFGEIEIGRLDRDTATSRDRLVAILDRFRRGQTKILVGTQMVAKGHDIPGVTLVGVLDADVALGMPDFRSAEKTMQLLCQVAGRAGRGDQPGRVLVQTRQPEHYAIEAARRQDPEYLYEHERPTRQLLGYPPFGHLVRVLFEDHDEGRTIASARSVREQLPPAPDGVQILGPAEAPLARLRGRFRYHLLIKGKERGPLRSVVEFISRQKPRWSTTRMVVDVDPQSLM